MLSSLPFVSEDREADLNQARRLTRALGARVSVIDELVTELRAANAALERAREGAADAVQMVQLCEHSRESVLRKLCAAWGEE